MRRAEQPLDFPALRPGLPFVVAAGDDGGPITQYLRETARTPLLTREGEIELALEMEDAAGEVLEALARAAVRLPALEKLAAGLEEGTASLDGVTRAGGRDSEEVGRVLAILGDDRAIRRSQVRRRAPRRGAARSRRARELAATRAWGLAQRRAEGLVALGLERRFSLGLAEELCKQVDGARDRRGRPTRPVAEERRRVEARYGRPFAALRAAVDELQGPRQRFDRAFSDLVVANLRLIISTAKRYASRGVAISDLVQEGNLGLLRAVDRFDPRLGYRFSTYATWWARQSVGRALAEQGRTVRVPVHVHDKLRRVRRAEQRLLLLLARTPTDEELGAALGLEASAVREILDCFAREVSLDRPLGDGDDRVLLDVFEDGARPDEDPVVVLDFRRAATRLLDRLRPKERWVVCRRFGLEGERPRTLQEIGLELGLTRERVRQIVVGALSRLKRAPEARELATIFAGS